VLAYVLYLADITDTHTRSRKRALFGDKIISRSPDPTHRVNASLSLLVCTRAHASGNRRNAMRTMTIFRGRVPWPTSCVYPFGMVFAGYRVPPTDHRQSITTHNLIPTSSRVSRRDQQRLSDNIMIDAAERPRHVMLFDFFFTRASRFRHLECYR